MSILISSTEQTRWKTCFEPSARAGVTLLCNGENPVRVYADNHQLVQAGFDAPTAVPTVTDGGGGGVLGVGYVVYRYCYASSLYPNVQAIVPAGGEEWPKSNPSPASATYHITIANHSNNVTVTKTTRSDVDWILIYRTAIKSTAAEATALGDAGELFYMGRIANNGFAGTAVYNDNTVAMQEQLELDNYAAPQFWVCRFDGVQWWGGGNPELIVSVTLAGTTTITAVANTFYSGRVNQFVTFDGITSGGFDGRGTYYFRYLSDSVANVATVEDGAAVALPASGTTTMRVRGYAGTLYRSKPNNPFAWGETERLVGAGGAISRVPQQYALALGGHICALALLPDSHLLKIDLENPSACYTLNLRLAGQDGFADSKQTLDLQYVCGSHHAQFVTRFPGGETMLTGLALNQFCLVKASAQNQAPFGDELNATLRRVVKYGDQPRLYHGVYNPDTELSVWWVKTSFGGASLTMDSDTALCYHGPSDQWSTWRDMDVTASASFLDPASLSTLTITGDAQGRVSLAFVEGVQSFPDNDSVIRVVTGFTSTAIAMSPVFTDTFTVPRWFLVSYESDLHPDIWIRATHPDFGYLQIDACFYPDINGVAYGNTGSTLPADFAIGGNAYMGIVNCEARTYFQPDQTKGNQARDFWGAFRNVGAETIFYRYYQEFDETQTGDNIVPVQDARRAAGGSNDGVNWVARGMPSALTPQFGLRLVERGYSAFEMLGLNIKVNAT